MTEQLTSKMVKDAVRALERANRGSTKTCPECGGAPFAPDESLRICPVCDMIYIPYEYNPPQRLHDLITDVLENGPRADWLGAPVDGEHDDG